MNNETLEAAAKAVDSFCEKLSKERRDRADDALAAEVECIREQLVEEIRALKAPEPGYSYEIGSGEHIDIKTPEQAEVEGIVSRLDEISNFIQLHHPNATNFIHLSEAAALITKQAEQIAALREALRTLSDAFLKYARHPRYCRSNAPHLKAEYGVDHCDCGLTEALSKTATLAYTDAS